MTSPARGGSLIPIRHYAKYVAQSRSRFENNDGSELNEAPFYQHPIWGVEGGSIYSTTPHEHMGKVAALAEECWAEAQLGLKHSTKNKEQAEQISLIMQGVHLLAQYYEKKVSAAIAAIVYAESKKSGDRDKTLKLADNALASYMKATGFMREYLDPYYKTISGQPLLEAGVGLSELMELEKADRRRIAHIFEWDGADESQTDPVPIRSSSTD